METELTGEKIKIGIIGGSGFYELLHEPEELIIKTPFGYSPLITKGFIKDKEVLFLPRHSNPGEKKISHSQPPHRINYRANIYALHKLGVNRIIATQSCGSMKEEIKPGYFIIPDQFIDFTKKRESTFFDGSNDINYEIGLKEKVIHVDMTHPFCSEINKIIFDSCNDRKVDAIYGGNYICTDGPRFETALEIMFFKKIGGDVVGMTLIPEIILSRELKICYSSISLVSNYAAGVTEQKLTFKEVVEEFNKNKNKLKDVLELSIKKIPNKKSCKC